MRKQLFLIVSLMLLSLCGYAQEKITVTGVVTSSADQLPLIGATVQIKGQKDK